MIKLHDNLKKALELYQESKILYSEVVFFPEKIYKGFYIIYYISVGVLAFSSIQIVNAYSLHRKFGSIEVLFSILTILSLIYLICSSYIEKIIKSFSKLQIHNNIDSYIANLPSKLIKPNLSNIIRESSVNKESLQLKLNNSVLISLTNGSLQLMSFLAGFFANALYESFKNGTNWDNVFNSLIVLVLLYFILLLVTHLLLDMFKSKYIYYIEMYDYQIKYIEYLNNLHLR